MFQTNRPNIAKKIWAHSCNKLVTSLVAVCVCRQYWKPSLRSISQSEQDEAAARVYDMQATRIMSIIGLLNVKDAATDVLKQALFFSDKKTGSYKSASDGSRRRDCHF